ncbi:MAG: Membrane protein, partial [uncultured Rubellimicrobium sp.]
GGGGGAPAPGGRSDDRRAARRGHPVDGGDGPSVRRHDRDREACGLRRAGGAVCIPALCPGAPLCRADALAAVAGAADARAGPAVRDAGRCAYAWRALLVLRHDAHPARGGHGDELPQPGLCHDRRRAVPGGAVGGAEAPGRGRRHGRGAGDPAARPAGGGARAHRHAGHRAGLCGGLPHRQAAVGAGERVGRRGDAVGDGDAGAAALCGRGVGAGRLGGAGLVLWDRGPRHGGALHDDAGLCGSTHQRDPARDLPPACLVGLSRRCAVWRAGGRLGDPGRRAHHGGGELHHLARGSCAPGEAGGRRL